MGASWSEALNCFGGPSRRHLQQLCGTIWPMWRDWIQWRQVLLVRVDMHCLGRVLQAARVLPSRPSLKLTCYHPQTRNAGHQSLLAPTPSTQHAEDLLRQGRQHVVSSSAEVERRGAEADLSGANLTGPTGSACVAASEFFSQCLPGATTPVPWTSLPVQTPTPTTSSRAVATTTAAPAPAPMCVGNALAAWSQCGGGGSALSCCESTFGARSSCLFADSALADPFFCRRLGLLVSIRQRVVLPMSGLKPLQRRHSRRQYRLERRRSTSDKHRQSYHHCCRPNYNRRASHRRAGELLGRNFDRRS